ncbi:sensor histidine kinase [Nitrospira sp. Kam-Ns4a]
MPNVKMWWTRRLTLGQKFLAAFALLLVLLGLSLAAILFYLSRINSYVDRHQRITAPAVATVAELQRQAFEMNVTLRALVETRAAPDRAGLFRTLETLEAEMRTALDLYRTRHAARTHPVLFRMLTEHGRAGLADREESALREIAALLDRLSARGKEIASRLQHSRQADADEQFADANRLSRRLIEVLTALVGVHTEIDREMKYEGDILLGRAKLVMLVLAVLLVLALAASYAAVSRHVARPLTRLATTADRVAHHDLSANFDPWPAHDEVGDLARSLQAMLVTLRERTVALERKKRELEGFTYSVAHDLKGPLREIEGFSALFEQKFAETLPPAARHYLATIRASSLRMTNLINDLLRYSRLEQQAIPMTRVNVRTMIEQLLADRIPTGATAPRVTVELPYAELWGEPTSIQQALLNLLDNALKFSRSVAEPHISIGGAVADRERVLWVQDNGIGFDEKDAERIFGLFERLHEPDEYEGTGVGLAIVKLVMDKHGGRVWANSTPGKGSVFYLAFPHNDAKGDG